MQGIKAAGRRFFPQQVKTAQELECVLLNRYRAVKILGGKYLREKFVVGQEVLLEFEAKNKRLVVPRDIQLRLRGINFNYDFPIAIREGGIFKAPEATFNSIKNRGKLILGYIDKEFKPIAGITKVKNIFANLEALGKAKVYAGKVYGSAISFENAEIHAKTIGGKTTSHGDSLIITTESKEAEAFDDSVQIIKKPLKKPREHQRATIFN